MVAADDGSGAREVFAFTDTGIAEKLYWFRSENMCWSADGKQLVTIVDTRKEAPSHKSPEALREFLLFIPVDGGKTRRVSIPKLGLGWVQAVDWR